MYIVHVWLKKHQKTQIENTNKLLCVTKVCKLIIMHIIFIMHIHGSSPPLLIRKCCYLADYFWECPLQIIVSVASLKAGKHNGVLKAVWFWYIDNLIRHFEGGTTLVASNFYPYFIWGDDASVPCWGITPMKKYKQQIGS